MEDFFFSVVLPLCSLASVFSLRWRCGRWALARLDEVRIERKALCEENCWQDLCAGEKRAAWVETRTGTRWRTECDFFFNIGFYIWIHWNHLSKYEMKAVANVLASRHTSVEVGVSSTYTYILLYYLRLSVTKQTFWLSFTHTRLCEVHREETILWNRHLYQRKREKC